MPERVPGGEVYEFKGGLPPFDEDVRFRLSRREGLDPLLFLESEREGGPRFICVPAEVVDAGYRVRLDGAAAADLGLEEGEFTAGGAAGWMALLLLTFAEGAAPTANLLAPVVLNPAARRGAQVIQFESDYPVAHPLRTEQGGEAC
jgi:flagellar assembly factor FliW